MKRREFLGSLGVLGIALPSVGMAAASTRVAPLQVVLLAPEASATQPNLGIDFVQGVKLALQNQNVQLVVKQVSFSTSSITNTAKALLEKSRPDVLMVFGDGLVSHLSPLAEAFKVPIVVAEVGARVARAREHHPFVFVNSLNLWQSEWALGAWAVRNLGRNAVIVSTLIDSGFDHLYAFESGLVSGGGRNFETLMLDTGTEKNRSAKVMASIRQLRPDFIHVVGSNTLARDFLAQHGGAKTMSAFVHEQQPTRAAIGVKSAFTWAASNSNFERQYQRIGGRSANAIAALGFETAQWIAGSAEQGRSLELMHALANSNFESARGLVSVNSTTHRLNATPVLREVRSVSGVLRHVAVQTLETVPEHHPALTALTSYPRSGWINPYLSIFE